MFAFGAGLVSPLNPCGFGLLPAFLGYQLSTDEQRGETPLARRLWHGLTAGGAVSIGFAGVLMSVALLVTLGLRPLLQFVPFAAVVIGAALVAGGFAMLTGRRIAVGPLDRLIRSAPAGDKRSGLVAFGAGYAVASVACTLAILLAVVAQALAVGTLPRTLGVLLAYGAGAATLLTTLTVSTAVAGSLLSTGLRRALPSTTPLAGVLLVLSGAYLMATNITGVRDAAPVRAVNEWVTDAAAQASALVQSSYLWFAPVMLALLVLATVLFTHQRRRRTGGSRGRVTHQATDAPQEECCAAGVVGAARAEDGEVGARPPDHSA